MQSAERISHIEQADHVIFQRSLFAYEEVAKLVSGKVVELGSGMGYGACIIAPKAEVYIAADKYMSEEVKKLVSSGSAEFIEGQFPPIKQLEDNSADFVITFQVVEHIQNDKEFLKEIHRVLKPGGSLILTTPNKKMSLTRNPWHVREYTPNELKKLLEKDFASVDIKGVFGHDGPMQYFERNRESVKKITRFDVFRFQYWMPRFILKIPYDILNRLNRDKLLDSAKRDVLEISTKDFFLENANDLCFDLFAIAKKQD